jgi:hypothetical protein
MKVIHHSINKVRLNKKSAEEIFPGTLSIIRQDAPYHILPIK